MAWYRAGTVSVTNGSAVVTGANTDFVSNTQQGEAFLGPDGRVYEVAAVVSATQISLGGLYQGASAGGQGYACMPTSSFARDLALGAAQLLNTFAVVRDGIGQGLIPDGSIATPGLRFANDQDTGMARLGANDLGLVTGGTTRLRLLADGSVQLGSMSANALGDTLLNAAAGGEFHRMRKAGPEGTAIVVFENGAGSASGFVQVVGNQGWAFAGAALYTGRHSTTGRSANFGGTINASGADYAEYMIKADGCGTIAPGDVCGVDVDGHLTRTWSAALSFVVKSTDPAYVGGDSWGQHVGPKPAAPGPEPVAPGNAPAMPASDDPDALRQWRAEADAQAVLLALHRSLHAKWVSDQAAFETALPAWEAELETARQCVDRIAFCGQVPVNVTGDFVVGDYIIAVVNGSGIKAIAVAEADITFDQYRQRIGKIWAVRDGRAWIDVQHG